MLNETYIPNEDFLCYVWQFRLLNSASLTSTEGKQIDIIHPGERNHNAGPDFTNARINIDGVLWVGNIEIHINTSDFKKHFHQNDENYKKLVLHIVYNADETIQTNYAVATLSLKDYVPHNLVIKYFSFLQSNTPIPCYNRLAEVPIVTSASWMQRLVIERMERKVADIEEMLLNNKGDWEEAFYQFLCRQFGFKVNAAPFELMAKATPLKIVSKIKDKPLSIEALLLGQAGKLNNEINDAYYRSLQKEYSYLKQAYNLQPIDPSLWKYLRLRPDNFPTIRIAQLADLLSKQNALFSKCIEQETVEGISDLLNCTASIYWETHYTFKKASEHKKKRLGNKATDILIINVIAPFTFAYGRLTDNPLLIDKAIDLLSKIPPEKNSIVNYFNNLKTERPNACHSQAKIQLYQNYCRSKKCLNCNIGAFMFKN